MPDKNLYNFLEEFIIRLDREAGSLAGYPLCFTLNLAKALGFGPQNNFDSNNTFFDMLGGHFSGQPPEHPYYLGLPLSETLSHCLSITGNGSYHLPFNQSSRNQLLMRMLEYFRLHISTFREIKSAGILAEVLRDDSG
jgi:DNA repair protein RecO (recombination protein O)